MVDKIPKNVLWSFSGSPFGFNVLDPSKVTVSGDNLKLVPCNKYANLLIHAKGGRESDIEVNIIGELNMLSFNPTNIYNV